MAADLERLSACWLIQVRFDDRGQALKLNFLGGEREYQLTIHKLVHFAMSSDDIADGLSETGIVELVHQFGVLDRADWNGYQFLLKEEDFRREFHLIQIFGAVSITIVCGGYSIAGVGGAPET